METVKTIECEICGKKTYTHDDRVKMCTDCFRELMGEDDGIL